ncbi:hypothetical protein DL95DRAFT_501577 [Leptodontidium sp. 2 PMI_412]|nr:hypothetical protein DL95DRAFT_501577 [Leptodontidium sp. 2 PMI_412]
MTTERGLVNTGSWLILRRQDSGGVYSPNLAVSSGDPHGEESPNEGFPKKKWMLSSRNKQGLDVVDAEASPKMLPARGVEGTKKLQTPAQSDLHVELRQAELRGGDGESSTSPHRRRNCIHPIQMKKPRPTHERKTCHSQSNDASHRKQRNASAATR